MRRGLGLDHARASFGTGVFGAHSDNDLVLRRNDIQPLRTILPDLDHIATAAGANDVFGIDDPLDAWQPRCRDQ